MLLGMADLAEIRAALAEYVDRIEAGTLLASDAERLVGEAAAIVNLGQSLEMILAKRVADSQLWRHRGHRTPADWLAGRTKRSKGEAIALLDTAERLADCPGLERKVRAGELSAPQAEVLARAVSVDPAAEPDLLRVAEVDGLTKLKDRCRAVEHAATDARARYQRIHRARSLRHWTDDEGALCLAARLTPDAGATVLGALAPYERAAFDQARVEGRREPVEAYSADALVAMADASLDEPSAGPNDAEGSDRSARPTRRRTRKPSFTVLVDATALRRGHAEPGETCEIPGVGPVPVSVLQAQAPDAVWHALVTDGVDVQAYASMSRHIPTLLRVALEARDRECVRPGCNASQGLEIDHIHEFAKGGLTRLSNLGRLCPHDHDLKTNHGWTLSGPPQARLFEPPRGPARSTADPDPP